MTFDKRTRDRLLSHCDQINEDDGLDPNDYSKLDQPPVNQDYRLLRLCSQVADTLHLVMAGEFGDERLINLRVVSVDPAPDATRLSVTLETDKPSTQEEQREILNRVGMVSGRLRSEVAASIYRKRTPRLTFRVIGPNDVF